MTSKYRVNYGDYLYKDYIWKEEGRFERTRKRAEPTKKKGRDYVSIFALTAVIICFAVTFLLSEFLSNGSLLAFKNVLTGDENKSYYALSVKRYGSVSEASFDAEELRNLGGGGYVYFDNGYYLIAGVYAEKADAETVLQRLKSSDAEVISLTFSTVKNSWYKGDKDDVETALTYAEKVYEKLYSLSVKLDNAELAEFAALAEISVLQNEIEALISTFDEKTKELKHENITRIKLEMQIAAALLDNLQNASLARPSLVADVRYTYTAVLVSYKNLCDAL